MFEQHFQHFSVINISLLLPNPPLTLDELYHSPNTHQLQQNILVETQLELTDIIFLQCSLLWLLRGFLWTTFFCIRICLLLFEFI